MSISFWLALFISQAGAKPSSGATSVRARVWCDSSSGGLASSRASIGSIQRHWVRGEELDGVCSKFSFPVRLFEVGGELWIETDTILHRRVVLESFYPAVAPERVVALGGSRTLVDAVLAYRRAGIERFKVFVLGNSLVWHLDSCDEGAGICRDFLALGMPIDRRVARRFEEVSHIFFVGRPGGEGHCFAFAERYAENFFGQWRPPTAFRCEHPPKEFVEFVDRFRSGGLATE